MSKVTSINLSGQNLIDIPDDVYKHSNLRKLKLSGNKITRISNKISKLKRLRVLDISNNCLTQLHAAIFSLPKLEILVISHNSIKTLPKQVEKLTNLKVLIAHNNKIGNNNLELLPCTLRKLDLAHNQISNVEWLNRLTQLRHLWIGYNNIQHDTLKNIIINIGVKHAYFNHNIVCSLEQDNSMNVLPRNNGHKIFISYSHKDKTWLDRLQVHMKALGNIGISVNYWDDTQIKAGDISLQQIADNLNTASIAILLVSTDFLASDFVMNQEVPKLLENAQQRGVRIIPFIIAPCMFTNSVISKYQAINDPKQTLSELSTTDQERTYLQLMQAISDCISN